MAHSGYATDFPAIREQILANVAIAFPLLETHGRTPAMHANSERYTIITHLTSANETIAIVVYGPNNKTFAEGYRNATVKGAMCNLLTTTSAIIGHLYGTGDLPTRQDVDITRHWAGSFDRLPEV